METSLNIQVSGVICSFFCKSSFEIQFLNHSGDKTFVIIAENPKMLQVSQWIASKMYNIAKPDWLYRALGSNKPIEKLIKFTRDDMLFATDSLKQKFDEDLELFDECDTQPMDEDETARDDAEKDDQTDVE